MSERARLSSGFSRQKVVELRIHAVIAAAFLAFFAVLVVLFGGGCAPPAVRDSGVYGAEVDFVEEATREHVEHSMVVLREECTCIEVSGVLGWETAACQDLAETVAVLRARMAYHTAFMRYLGGLSDVRPEEEPPDVPEASSLCPSLQGDDADNGGDQ